jgi:signal transduction histidine kinase
MTPNPFTELLDRVAGGLLWVQTDGRIRHANEEARRLVALRVGDWLDDPALVRAVQVVARGREPRSTLLTEAAHPQPCRVLPGLGVDDAFVMLAATPARDVAFEGSELLLRAADHHLREPLARTHAALSFWREDGDAHAQSALADELEGLLRRMDSLCELSRLWAGVDALQEERVELWPLLQQAWSVVEPRAMDRNVGLHFSCATDQLTRVVVYGHRDWLRRALIECLQAAVDATESGGQLTIDQRQLGSRAVVRFCVPMLFADAGGAGRDAITLTLCRQVLALHGGTLSPDPVDGHWILELPTGAPLQGTSADQGIAQAQVYARDLAVLRNRSRRVAKVQA